MSAEAHLIAEICAIGAKPFVEAVENHFAGHFNELRIAVKLKPEARDEDVIALQNELLAHLGATSRGNPDFTWMATFSRGGAELRSLFPGDMPRTGAEDLQPAD